MPEEEKSVSQQENVNDSTDYIEAIKEMKQNTVSREAYLKLKDENKKLLDSIINGNQLEEPVKKKEQVNVDEVRKKLFSQHQDMSNLEYVNNALKLRDALLEKGEPDPFLPWGEKIMPTQEDIECANRVANVLKDCVEYADGDSAVFTNELQRLTVDTAPMRRR